MNLKESFRYQNFLESILDVASNSLTAKDHCLVTTKTHLRNAANPDAEDITEQVKVDDFYSNDTVLEFVCWLVAEKEKLTKAIGKAKASIEFDIDAAVETNKFRQRVSSTIKRMMFHSPRTFVERGCGYKFNNEGNQASYYYDIETTTTEAYDKVAAKSRMKSLMLEADQVSTKIDEALINTQVEYTPCFDVNDTFEDAIEIYVSLNDTKAEDTPQE